MELLGGGDILGCTDDDAAACNYDDSATADDGSCTYPDSEFVDCDGNCLAAIDCAGECGGSSVLDDCGVCGGDGSSCALYENLLDTEWKLYPGAGALGVGPARATLAGGQTTLLTLQLVHVCLTTFIGSTRTEHSRMSWATTLGLKDGRPDLTVVATLWPRTTDQIQPPGRAMVRPSWISGTGATWAFPSHSMEENSAIPADAPASITYEITSLSTMHDAGHQLWSWMVALRICASGNSISTYDVTFRLMPNNIVVGPNGMYAGGGALGSAQALQLSDDDGDGIWSGTMTFQRRNFWHFIFLNSPNDGGDWGAKETLRVLSVEILRTTTTAFCCL